MSNHKIVYIAALFAAVSAARGASIYVSPTGTGTGSQTAPYGSIQSAVNAAVSGDTIYLLAGTYSPTTNIQITKSGTATSPITLRPYGSDKVIIDGEALPGLINGPYGVYARDASHNYYELLSTHDNYETGFQLQGASENNTVIYLDSYRNRDPRKNGESADGFACKEGSGEGNVLRNARLWDNVDDGLDLYMFGSAVAVDEVYAWGNGVNRWGFSPFEGDGNGFKLGITGNPPADHAVTNSMAFANAKKGFIDNGNPGSLTFRRNTAWNNGDTGFLMRSSASALTGNIAAVNSASPQVSLTSNSTSSGNSWDASGTWSNGSFVSVDPTTLKGARGADGSVQASNFLIPASGAAIGASTKESV
ncbi:hypothetical protein KJ359_006560 [Pestalotiopsis sp. 9143b]|nr:hypothetical protein KJ359_006560 [Pestalotiopsis sp. 9143b]